MRVRTGHKPSDWSDNQPGFNAYARTPHVGKYAAGGYSVIAGQYVQGDAGKVERDRAINREKARRKAVDMDDYHKANRWEGKPRCGVMLPQAGEPCFRTPKHTGDHRTAYAMKCARERRRAVA